MAGREPSPDGYDLSIDTQVQEFTKLKQQLTYFIVSASVAVIVFAVNLAKDIVADDDQLRLLAIASIAGVGAAGCALLNLHLQLSSYRLHLKYRTAGVRDFTQLPRDDREAWDRLNGRAAKLLTASFGFLATEILFAAWFMWLLLAG